MTDAPRNVTHGWCVVHKTWWGIDAPSACRIFRTRAEAQRDWLRVGAPFGATTWKQCYRHGWRCKKVTIGWADD